MANISSIVGVIEFYSKLQYENLEKKFAELPTEDNFFNITVGVSYMNNMGSILIPFARSFKADREDDMFVSSKIEAFETLFSDIEMYSIEMYCDYYYLGRMHYIITFNQGDKSLVSRKIYFEDK